jgi:hypothetical protein
MDTVDEPAFLTFWSYIHLISGILLFVVVSYFGNVLAGKSISPWITITCAFLIHLAYESKDMYLSYISESKQSTSNSILNSVGDQICGTIGILLAFLVLGPSCTQKDVLTFTVLYFNLYLLATTINYET